MASRWQDWSCYTQIVFWRKFLDYLMYRQRREKFFLLTCQLSRTSYVFFVLSFFFLIFLLTYLSSCLSSPTKYTYLHQNFLNLNLQEIESCVFLEQTKFFFTWIIGNCRAFSPPFGFLSDWLQPIYFECANGHCNFYRYYLNTFLDN